MSYISDNKAVLVEMMECVAIQFGENCEVVLHDLTLPYDRTIVAIINGHVTGRKVGGSGTNTGLEVLREAMEKGRNGKDPSKYNYINRSEDGRVLRSSSKYFMHDGEIVGSFCINYDITETIAIQKAANSLAFLNGGDESKELFVENVDDILEFMLYDAVSIVGKKVEDMKKEDKIKAIKYLDKKGALLIRKSAERISEYFNISRFSLYNYLEEGKEQEER